MEPTLPRLPDLNHTRSDWRFMRRPIIALIASGILLALAYVLDRGGETQRDLGLLIGIIALYGLLPLTTIWIVGATTVELLRRRRD